MIDDRGEARLVEERPRDGGARDPAGLVLRNSSQKSLLPACAPELTFWTHP